MFWAQKIKVCALQSGNFPGRDKEHKLCCYWSMNLSCAAIGQ